MKRSAIFLLVLGLIVTLFGRPAAAATPLTVQINGFAVNAPSGMNIIEGQVMVPLRWAAEQLGANSVQWDSGTHTVTIKTGQDFYNLKKLASYAYGLQTNSFQQEAQVWPIPDSAKSLDLSPYVPDHAWILELKKPISHDYINICITSDDGSFEHTNRANSIENYQGHYYLPMEWLEYLFNVKVNYNPTSNVLSLETPDMEKIKVQIAQTENTLIPATPDEAIKLWGRGEQIRNGALQYASLSPQLRKEADKSYFVQRGYWVTGCSSPQVGPITIISRNQLSDTEIEYTLSFPEITSAPHDTSATEKMTVEKLTVNGQNGWFITQLLQSSNYGIIDGLYKSNSLYLSADRITLPLPAKWTIEYSIPITLKNEQDNSIGTIEEIGGYYLPNHRSILSDKKLFGGLGESHLLLMDYQSPAASKIQESWQEVHAMIPLKSGHWLDVCIKVNPGEDAAELQTFLENAIMGAN